MRHKFIECSIGMPSYHRKRCGGFGRLGRQRPAAGFWRWLQRFVDIGEGVGIGVEFSRPRGMVSALRSRVAALALSSSRTWISARWISAPSSAQA